MIHKSQKTIKYYFFLKKRTFLGLIALKTILKRQQYILFFVTFTHMPNELLKNSCTGNFWVPYQLK